MDPTTRQSILKNLSTTKELPVSTAAKLLEVNRTSIYYTPVGITEEELTCKVIIDRLHTDNPAWGARQMSKQLKRLGYDVGRKKARRYMTDMAIDPIYPKMNLSKRAHNAHIKPYLLKHAVITRPNQAWSIDYPDDYVIPIFYITSQIQATTSQKYRDNFSAHLSP